MPFCYGNVRRKYELIRQLCQVQGVGACAGYASSKSSPKCYALGLGIKEN